MRTFDGGENSAESGNRSSQEEERLMAEGDLPEGAEGSKKEGEDSARERDVVEGAARGRNRRRKSLREFTRDGGVDGGEGGRLCRQVCGVIVSGEVMLTLHIPLMPGNFGNEARKMGEMGGQVDDGKEVCRGKRTDSQGSWRHEVSRSEPDHGLWKTEGTRAEGSS